MCSGKHMCRQSLRSLGEISQNFGVDETYLKIVKDIYDFRKYCLLLSTNFSELSSSIPIPHRKNTFYLSYPQIDPIYGIFTWRALLHTQAMRHQSDQGIYERGQCLVNMVVVVGLPNWAVPSFDRHRTMRTKITIKQNHFIVL